MPSGGVRSPVLVDDRALVGEEERGRQRFSSSVLRDGEESQAWFDHVLPHGREKAARLDGDAQAPAGLQMEAVEGRQVVQRWPVEKIGSASGRPLPRV